MFLFANTKSLKVVGATMLALYGLLAQQPSMATESALTLPELLALTRQENPLLEQTRQMHKVALANVPLATAWSNPQVGLIQNPIPSNPLHLSASQGFSQTLTQPFQLFGKKKLAGEIAQDQADAVGTQVTATDQLLKAQVKTTFFQLLAYQHQERISQDNIQRLEQIKRISKIRYANNAAAYVDYLNAQVAQSSAQNDLFALQRQIDTTRQTLNTLIGRDPQKPLEVSGSIPGLSDKVLSLEELTTLTLQRNPSLKGSALQVSAAEKGLTYAKKSYLPDFQIIATHISDNPPWGLSGKTYGLELDLILPTWFFEKERATVDQAKANLMANQAGDVLARQQVLLGVASTYNNWLQARKQFDFIKTRQLPEAQVAWRLAMQAYANNNSQAFSDLLMAQSNLRNTELALLQAESSVAQTWAGMEAAVGTELENL